MAEFTHFDAAGAARMVDVGDKPVTVRTARASAVVEMAPATLAAIRDRRIAKGDVLELARTAGIMAAKHTHALIPLCHLLPLDAVGIEFAFPDEARVRIEATARATARTGVEMEALVAATVCGLTIYDMCKAVDRALRLTAVQLEEKAGGRSGSWRRHAGDDRAPEPG